MVDIITDTHPGDDLTTRARAWIAAGALAATIASAVAALSPGLVSNAPPPPAPAPVAVASPAASQAILSGPVVTTQVLVRPRPTPAVHMTPAAPVRTVRTSSPPHPIPTAHPASHPRPDSHPRAASHATPVEAPHRSAVRAHPARSSHAPPPHAREIKQTQRPHRSAWMRNWKD